MGRGEVALKDRVEGRWIAFVGKVTRNPGMELAGNGRRVGVRLALRGVGRIELDLVLLRICSGSRSA